MATNDWLLWFRGGIAIYLIYNASKENTIIKCKDEIEEKNEQSFNRVLDLILRRRLYTNQKVEFFIKELYKDCEKAEKTAYYRVQ